MENPKHTKQFSSIGFRLHLTSAHSLSRRNSPPAVVGSRLPFKNHSTAKSPPLTSKL